MEIDRTTFDDALSDPGLGGAGAIEMIDEALANGERVIVRERDGSKSLLEPGEKGKKYKSTPIAPA